MLLQRGFQSLQDFSRHFVPECTVHLDSGCYCYYGNGRVCKMVDKAAILLPEANYFKSCNQWAKIKINSD